MLNECVVCIPFFFWRRLSRISRHVSISVSMQMAKNIAAAISVITNNDSGTLNE
ncbi:hypothetical protein SB521682_1873 [Shigella boydii 5216-82]|nr:hypothetical protein SB521682_3799 [Shigella boydii 5216-82]EGI95959.1 hypothetical protein SB521682_1873 [Shigella boydii 5216-82]